MPWEFSIVRRDGTSLGDLASVQNALESALPDVRFFREPGGPEKIAAAALLGVEFPEVLRQQFENSSATTQADFEGEDFSIRFYLGAGPDVTRIDAEGRGEGNPGPSLRLLEELTGWVVQESDGSRWERGEAQETAIEEPIQAKGIVTEDDYIVSFEAHLRHSTSPILRFSKWFFIGLLILMTLTIPVVLFGDQTREKKLEAMPPMTGITAVLWGIWFWSARSWRVNLRNSVRASPDKMRWTEWTLDDGFSQSRIAESNVQFRWSRFSKS